MSRTPSAARRPAADPSPGQLYAAEVRELYDLSPSDDVQLGMIVTMMDDAAEIEREAAGAPWTITGSRGAELPNPIRVLAMRARRELRDAIRVLNLPDPGGERLTPSEIGARAARARWANHGAS